MSKATFPDEHAALVADLSERGADALHPADAALLLAVQAAVNELGVPMTEVVARMLLVAAKIAVITRGRHFTAEACTAMGEAVASGALRDLERRPPRTLH
ncbi:hypothetical protein SAMN05421763_10230 [[Luteovulum] sphaeroides subsp. megalophilum]|uniref:hypothetical protein n=1 Tax=Cereibacter sphaeroides TaxID=1063 RepID=UPI000B6DFFEE|nr:hypothetical protein [Cereibacter sphaeroides]SNS51042.1 hypothetical protein SAMN05421763_10230 [[Luteovulum] sphaeroides subsp. megalophilum]